jgi:hypothetical protein
MMWRDIGYLMTEVEIYDKYNKPKITYIEEMVYCNKKSVKGIEFYQAQAQGIKPELVIEVKTYNEQSHLKFNNTIYRVIRTYSKSDEVIELVLTSTLVENN